ncbi:MAG: hypothetical protein ACE5GW_08750, partial [Planctomycetota bacterium]
MPVISVLALRWLLVVVNLGVLGLLGYGAVDFFRGPQDELELKLPDPKGFAVPEERTRGSDDRQLNSLIVNLYRKPPIKAAPRPVPTEDPNLPPAETGPLSGWEVLSVIIDPEVVPEERFAQVRERVQSTSITPKGRSARRGSARRARSNVRSSSRNRRGRGRRTQQRVKQLRQGREITIDEKTFYIERVTRNPDRVIYSLGPQRYTLTKDADTESYLRVEEDQVRLVGRDLEEEERAAGGAAPKLPAEELGKLQLKG